MLQTDIRNAEDGASGSEDHGWIIARIRVSVSVSVSIIYQCLNGKISVSVCVCVSASAIRISDWETRKDRPREAEQGRTLVCINLLTNLRMPADPLIVAITFVISRSMRRTAVSELHNRLFWFSTAFRVTRSSATHREKIFEYLFVGHKIYSYREIIFISQK